MLRFLRNIQECEFKSRIEIGILIQMRKAIVAVACLFGLSQGLTCDQGMVSNPSKICIQPTYIEGCLEYQSESACKTCEYRYAKNAKGLCQIDPEPSESCCLLKNSDGSCGKCQKGLFNINGSCEESNIVGCLEKDVRGKCVNCASGFLLKDGTCIQGIKKCAVYTNAAKKQCSSCAPNYSLINNLCVQNTILGCKRQESFTCEECYPPFQPLASSCIVPNCKTVNEFGCIACQCAYHLTPERTCKPIETGCIRYQRGTCTDCLPHYKLKGNVCEIEGCLDKTGMDCNKCQDGYDLKEGGCQLKNCLDWNNGLCNICKEGYNYSSGLCVKSSAASTAAISTTSLTSTTSTAAGPSSPSVVTATAPKRPSSASV